MVSGTLKGLRPLEGQVDEAATTQARQTIDR